MSSLRTVEQDEIESDSVVAVSSDAHLASSSRKWKLWRQLVENGVFQNSITEPGGGLGLRSSKLKSKVEAMVEASSNSKLADVVEWDDINDSSAELKELKEPRRRGGMDGIDVSSLAWVLELTGCSNSQEVAVSMEESSSDELHEWVAKWGKSKRESSIEDSSEES